MKAFKKRNTEIGRKTDVGRVRTANEDSMGDLPVEGGHVFIVADGMGGYRGGAIASSLVVEAIEEYFLDCELLDPQKALRESIFTANERIYLRGNQDEELSRMGSTCVLALVKSNRLHLAHVGDSRIYLARKNGPLQRLTRDHTVVQHFVDVGLLSEEEADGHPDSHILSRALGPRAHVEPELRDEPVHLHPGDRVLLCSDGLTKMLAEQEIHTLLTEKSSLQDIADKLVDVANQHGGEDNVTVLTFEFSVEQEGEPISPDQALDFSDDTPPLSSSLESLEHHQPGEIRGETKQQNTPSVVAEKVPALPDPSTKSKAVPSLERPDPLLTTPIPPTDTKTQTISASKNTTRDPHQK